MLRAESIGTISGLSVRLRDILFTTEAGQHCERDPVMAPRWLEWGRWGSDGWNGGHWGSDRLCELLSQPLRLFWVVALDITDGAPGCNSVMEGMVCGQLSSLHEAPWAAQRVPDSGCMAVFTAIAMPLRTHILSQCICVRCWSQLAHSSGPGGFPPG